MILLLSLLPFKDLSLGLDLGAGPSSTIVRCQVPYPSKLGAVPLFFQVGRS